MTILATVLLTLVGLSSILSNDSIDSLIENLDQLTPETRMALVERGEAAIPSLAKVLEDPKASQERGTNAALVLGAIGGRKAVPPLIFALDKRHIRWSAIVALGEVGPEAKQAASRLAEIVSCRKEDSVHPIEVDAAIKSLGQIGDGGKEVIAALVKIVASPNDERGTSRMAALALLQLGEPGGEALIALARNYENRKNTTVDGDYSEAYSIIAWGGPIPKELAPLYLKHLDAKGEMSDLASLALASIGAPAKTELLKRLDSENRETRLLAAKALARMNFHAQSARRFRGEEILDPVSPAEVFPKFLTLIRHPDGKPDYLFLHAMLGIDQEKAWAEPEFKKAMQELFNESLRTLVETDD